MGETGSVLEAGLQRHCEPPHAGNAGNPEQQKAIAHGAGPMMVLAGPGSGKTFVLTRRIAHLINEHHVAPAEILVITFTKAAAAEMQKRFLSLCGGTHPPVTFGTFHAVFYSILRETSVCRAGSILSEQEKKKLLRDIILRNRYDISLHTDMLEEILSEIGRCKCRADDMAGYRQNRICASRSVPSLKDMGNNSTDFMPRLIPPSLFSRIYRDFKEAQEILGKVDFDDMALKCWELFQDRPDILRRYQERYRHLLIDEFQDIAPLQYRLVRQLAAPEDNLFIVGDDDQSIYGFRGAKPDIMVNFPRDYRGTQTVALRVNYRSTPEVVESAKRLIAHNKNRFPKDSRAENAHGIPVRKRGFGDVGLMEGALIRYLLEERNAGQLSACAVIHRTSGCFPLLAEKLRQAGIPCHFKEKIKSIYEHEMVGDLLAYLEFSRTPLKGRSRAQFFRFMNRPLRYINREAVDERADFAHMMQFYEGRPAMQEEIRRLRYDLERIAAMPVFLAIHYIRKSMRYDAWLSEKYALKKDLDARDAGVQILEMADLIQDSARGCKTFARWQEVIEERKNSANGEAAAERGQSAGDRKANGKEAGEKNGVALMTMHGSKGLEYDKVFILNCNERVTPHKKAVSEAEIEEERRMFYVAMTRAKKELTLLYIEEEEDKKEGGSAGKRTPPSRFLKEIENHSISSNS